MAFIWLMLVDVLIVVAGMLWVYFKHSQSILQWKVRWSRAVGLLKDSWPLILSAAMITIYMRIDQIMLGNMTSNEVVGNYAAAVKLSEAWYFVPIIICSSVFPAIIRAKHRSAQEYYRKMQQLYDLLAWISLAVTVPTTFFSSNLMTALVGKEYISAGPILALTMWAGPFVFLGVARSQWLVAENLTQFSFLSTALGAITNVVLNLILIPHYGGSGAALATVISYALASYFSCFLFPPLIKAGLQQTKAIIVPFRINQNIIYFRQVFQLLGFNQ
jgi:O-antigen/teichoic acid export membrane protein